MSTAKGFTSSKIRLKNASTVQGLRCHAKPDSASILFSKVHRDVVLNVLLIPPSAGLRFKTKSTPC
jgi:hypothetical protein